MGWYRVIKTIKGHRYVYDQRSWREGKHVRTENRYVGPADGVGTRVTITPGTLYHGAREGIEGLPAASGEGTFGPGFYLTNAELARRYAPLTAKLAANPDGDDAYGPRFDGTVYAIETGHLNLKVTTWGEFLDRCEDLTELKAATPEAKTKLQELLIAEGYDGLDIRDTNRPEVVVFPAALHKLEPKPVTTTKRSEFRVSRRTIMKLDSILAKSAFAYDDLTDEECRQAREITEKLGMSIDFGYEGEGALLFFEEYERADIHFAQELFRRLLWERDKLPLEVRPDGTVVVYHGTSAERAKAILEGGFDDQVYFSASPDKQCGGVAGAGYYGDTVLEVMIDPRMLGYNGLSEFHIFDNAFPGIKAICVRQSEA